MIKKIKHYFINRSDKKFGKRYREAVVNLTGGLDYTTIEFKKKVLREMDRIEKSKNNEIKAYIVGGIIGALIGIEIQLLFDLSKSLF